ncbi:MAG: maleylacetoacetate isomerase [Rhodocyclaceae bacterium]|nr:maleylacetoacetate isomerase [Rhodocyclaceae bacterium]
MMKLYSYWRSSAAYRVRIGLHLKGIAFEYVAVDLSTADGAQHEPDYVALNPQHLVPTLVDGDMVIGQSLAILEYLDERFPAPSLLPESHAARASARQVALVIGADLHPLNNLRVLRYLEIEGMLGDAARRAWYHHWLKLGLAAAERLVAAAGPYALGATVGLADLFIVPQLYNARRYGFPLTAYPRLRRIDEACAALDAFALASPERQPDAPPAAGR